MGGWRWRRRLIGLGVALTLCGCASPLSFDLASAPPPTTLSPAQISEVVKPAIALVQVDFKANLNLPRLHVAKDKDQVIVNKLIARLRAGTLADTNEAINKAYVAEVGSNPGFYFSANNADMYTQDFTSTFTGTGMVVTPDGYILTSAHVVATPDAEITAGFTKEFVDGVQGEEARAALAKTDFPPEDIPRYQAFLAQYIPAHLKYTGLTRAIHVGLGRATPGLPLATGGLLATVADAGTPVPGEDVAVIKVSAHGLPTVALESNSHLTDLHHHKEEITNIGYPGESIFQNQDTNPRAVEPTMTHGLWVPEGITQTDYKALASTGYANHGDSGGPMLNSHGHVVGVIAFVELDAQGAVTGGSFGVPTDVALKHLKLVRVKSSESPATVTYRHALSELAQSHFAAALALFKQVKATWPDHPFVQGYIDRANAGIASRADRTPPPLKQLLTWVVEIVVGLAAVVVLAVVIIGLLRRQRRLRRDLAVALARVEAAEELSAAAAEAPPVPVEAAAAVADAQAPARTRVARPRAARKPPSEA